MHSVVFAFASNLFEHLSQEDFARVLSALREKLTSAGDLVILQPNYRYAYREYFDDYTHRTIYSHISLSDSRPHTVTRSSMWCGASCH